ncbi:MAG: shikimate dehydrogenase [Tissierellia bacterium]|nr:shikimate dehydrogenase [Tissierellia bacterium]
MEKLFGLIGEKLGHTYSPMIHNKILSHINIIGHYGLFQVKRENLKYVIQGLKALGYDGVNVTIPYKTEIMKYLDFISPEAKRIGAVNVIKIDNEGIATGYNSDYFGFGMSLNNANINIHREKAVILGTGGASKAIVQYLKDNKVREIIIVTRNISSAKEKYTEEKIITYEDLKNIKDSSLIINTTPVGMYPNIDNSPINIKILSNFFIAVDLIYNPFQTLFLKNAQEAGLKTLNGMYMLVAQAVKSQEIWNNITISPHIINEVEKLFYK